MPSPRQGLHGPALTRCSLNDPEWQVPRDRVSGEATSVRLGKWSVSISTPRISSPGWWHRGEGGGGIVNAQEPQGAGAEAGRERRARLLPSFTSCLPPAPPLGWPRCGQGGVSRGQRAGLCGAEQVGDAGVLCGAAVVTGLRSPGGPALAAAGLDREAGGWELSAAGQRLHAYIIPHMLGGHTCEVPGSQVACPVLSAPS